MARKTKESRLGGSSLAVCSHNLTEWSVTLLCQLADIQRLVNGQGGQKQTKSSNVLAFQEELAFKDSVQANALTPSNPLT